MNPPQNNPQPVSEGVGEVPLEELLRFVPKSKRLSIRTSPNGFMSIPVGHHCHDAADKITALRDELDDIKNATKGAMDETCGNEKHCTCVPLLRAELAKAQGEVERLQGELTPSAAVEAARHVEIEKRIVIKERIDRLREAFYDRTPLGDKVSDRLNEDYIVLHEAIYRIINDGKPV